VIINYHTLAAVVAIINKLLKRDKTSNHYSNQYPVASRLAYLLYFFLLAKNWNINGIKLNREGLEKSLKLAEDTKTVGLERDRKAKVTRCSRELVSCCTFTSTFKKIELNLISSIQP
jgi:hypothetical protein